MSKKIKINKYASFFYAGASGDFNQIHIDEKAAKKSGLKGIVLQGLCTMGIVSNHLLGMKNPSIIKKIKVRFSKPVYPNDELKIIINKNKFTVLNQFDDEVISKGEIIFEED